MATLPTPGPWWASRDNEIIMDPMGNIKIGKVYAISESNDGSVNAKLIAAAPDMLQALIYVKQSMLKTGINYENADLYNIIKTAIGKAIK